MQKLDLQTDFSFVQQLHSKQLIKSRELRLEPPGARKKRLKTLRTWIEKNRTRIQEAVYSDFRKPALEADLSEIMPVISEINHALRNLDDWCSQKKVDAPLPLIGSHSEVRYEPKGTCLIISPWNFPFNLCIGPLVSCLAAGNTAILKPSELTPHTSKVISELGSIFDAEVVAVIEGGIEAATALLQLQFDHIFFTGSPGVGRQVMKAAAVNLTSVTLELGGKSPAIIDETADVKIAARRIAFGKFINNGQTCVAPDYLMVHKKIHDRFVDELKKVVVKMFGTNGSITAQSPDYCRIISEKHFHRIHHLVQDAIELGASPALSGPSEPGLRFLHPVILTGVPLQSRIMEEEIFGPVLPVLSYSEVSEVIHIINGKPKPLALYIFSNNKKIREKIITATSSGTVCINDCVVQFAHVNLPFGGVNNSGIGKSHGYHGFLAFSNEKPVMKQIRRLAIASLMYPPYKPFLKKLVNVLLKVL